MGWVLDGSEIGIFDTVVSDQTEAGGDEINFYSVNKQKSQIDPLYGEYIKRQIDGPWRLPAVVRWPQRNPMASEAGFTVEFDGECTVARVHLDEKKASYPSEGDIIEMWRGPYFDTIAMGGNSVGTQGLFFDVIKVVTQGHLNDTDTFTEFKMTLKRRPQFSAERRLVTP